MKNRLVYKMNWANKNHSHEPVQRTNLDMSFYDRRPTKRERFKLINFSDKRWNSSNNSHIFFDVLEETKKSLLRLYMKKIIP